MVPCRITVTEKPNHIKVEIGLLPEGGALQTVSGRWGNDEDVYCDADSIGKDNVLKAALTAWLGPSVEELTYDELVARSGGWL